MKSIKLYFWDWLFNIAGKAVCKAYSSVLMYQQNVAKIASLFYQLKNDRDFIVN